MKNNFTQKLTKVIGLIALTGLSNLGQAQFEWSSAGPVYTAGRARNMVVDKMDPSGKTLYLGSTTSGVFKSTNAGATWAPIDDQGTVRNISYMAQSADGSIIYAATGEGFLRYGQKAKAQRGTGLYKLNSSGNGLVLVKDSTAVGAIINRVACDPSNNSHLALATNKGILVSVDGGATFSAPIFSGYTPTANVTFGLDVKFDNAGILYCSIGNERGNHTAFGGAASPSNPNFSNIPSKIFKSTSSGLTNFNDITPYSSILTDQNYGRIELAIAPTDNNVIYASCANKNTSLPGSTQVLNSASLKGLFVSYDGGTTWGLIIQGSAQLDPMSNGGTISVGDYAHVIAVSPNSRDALFIGGHTFELFNRTGGTNISPFGSWIGVDFSQPNFLNTPYYVHENIHDIKIVPGNPAIFYFITDAGVYRSSDFANSSTLVFPTFQPFYKGLVTGQFNSVSIERFPSALTPTNQGGAVQPFTGFIGGTGANGFNYYSGRGSTQVTKEVTYLSGDVYNAEYSKILDGTALLSVGSGAMYRTTNAKNSAPTVMNFNKYSGKTLSKVAPDAQAFYNTDITTGTPFKLWENYGQITNSPDKAIFYNDSLRFQYSFGGGVQSLTTTSTFSFTAARPSRAAMIDSIVIRTATVNLPLSDPTLSNSPLFSGNDKQDITIKMPKTYTVATNTISTVNVPTTNIIGPAQGQVSVSFNPIILQDNITVTFTAPPFATKTINLISSSSGTVSDPSGYYRVFATVFYKYKTGDTVRVTDNNISNKLTTYEKVLSAPISWDYSTTNLPQFTVTANTNTAITSPTYVLSHGNNVFDASNTTGTFVVSPRVKTTYSMSQTGTYTLSATPVAHTIIAVPNGGITSPTYVLNPGGISQTTTTFVVTPTVGTSYTITETGTGTLTSDTYSTIGTSTYNLDPGNISQTSPDFIVSPTVATTYTLNGVSSNTATGLNTTKTASTTVANYTLSVNTATLVPFAAANTPIKINTARSSRLAMCLNNQNVTADGLTNQAIVVSKNPLNLNDPLNFVRVSQNGCLTDNPDGTPSATTTIAIPGKPILLEWSKGGTEIYYATNDNKLYRVSHINDIMDLSAASYSGKFYTDVFVFTDVNSASALNPNCPYRTTLVGSFDKPITSISVAKDDKSVILTFNNPTQTGTTGIVMTHTADIRTANSSNIGWVKKDDANLGGNLTYCSLIENSKGGVFVGTDNGLYYSTNISSTPATWSKVNNNKLPNVQIFDIKQQTFESHNCYNSGQIYVATNGRGVWTTDEFFSPYLVGTEEYIEKAKNENNLAIYPNPANGNVTFAFDAVDGEKATLNVMDLSGRTVHTVEMGKLAYGATDYSFDISSLTPGIYIVDIRSTSNIKRVSKLVVSK